MPDETISSIYEEEGPNEGKMKKGPAEEVAHLLHHKGKKYAMAREEKLQGEPTDRERQMLKFMGIVEKKGSKAFDPYVTSGGDKFLVLKRTREGYDSGKAGYVITPYGSLVISSNDEGKASRLLKDSQDVVDTFLSLTEEAAQKVTSLDRGGGGARFELKKGDYVNVSFFDLGYVGDDENLRAEEEDYDRLGERIKAVMEGIESEEKQGPPNLSAEDKAALLF